MGKKKKKKSSSSSADKYSADDAEPPSAADKAATGRARAVDLGLATPKSSFKKKSAPASVGGLAEKKPFVPAKAKPLARRGQAVVIKEKRGCLGRCMLRLGRCGIICLCLIILLAVVLLLLKMMG